MKMSPCCGGVICWDIVTRDAIKSSGRSLHFTCERSGAREVASAGFKIPLAIIGLVCPEARVKFDFHTEADFASYCKA